jgi:hypothetical protein
MCTGTTTAPDASIASGTHAGSAVAIELDTMTTHAPINDLSGIGGSSAVRGATMRRDDGQGREGRLKIRRKRVRFWPGVVRKL